MTPSELKQKIEDAGHSPHFFTRSTMKFFGDTMQNYGVCEATIDTPTEKGVKCWSLFRRRPVKNGLQSPAFFDAVTFKRRFPEREA